VTCSADLSVYVWRHYGDRWQSNFIDVAKCYDESLSYQRKACDKSTKTLKLTALVLFPRKSLLLVADNRNVVRVFTLGTDSASLANTYRIARSPQLSGDL